MSSTNLFCRVEGEIFDRLLNLFHDCGISGVNASNREQLEHLLGTFALVSAHEFFRIDCLGKLPCELHL